VDRWVDSNDWLSGEHRRTTAHPGLREPALPDQVGQCCDEVSDCVVAGGLEFAAAHCVLAKPMDRIPVARLT
jgi:hypothetical protein